jgi:septal ring factor EnvC (AmiA/AmiB activator)
MRKQQDFDLTFEVKKALKGKQVPVLVLDSRWHTLFPPGKKPADVVGLEEDLNSLLKRQGYLVNDIKDLKKTKQKLMKGIVAGMNGESEFDDKKRDNQQRLMYEINARIEEESDELLLLPKQIKEMNEELLVTGARYCFERLENGDREIERLKQEIKALKNELNDKTDEKQEIEESMDSAYSLMHGILGHSVMNIYDKTHRK